MSRQLKALLKRVLPDDWLRQWRDILPGGWAHRSYSQEGEDMVLRRYFDSQEQGFFVDVGAHHPKRLSNTYYFYRRGWRGINIDPKPGFQSTFDRERPRDINLQVAISDIPEELTYYMFAESAFNSFSPELAKVRARREDCGPALGTATIRARRLDEVLAESLPAGQPIDFLSVDVEGLDLSVLQSNDWARYRPAVVVVEVLGASLDSIRDTDVCRYLESQGYFLFAKCVQSVIFEDGSARARRLASVE
jgi:FkbM family methyltransferase